MAETPNSDAVAPPAAPVFYEPKQIGAITFVFGPLAGVVLMARNWKAFGEASKAKKFLFAGPTITLMALAVADKLPDNIIYDFAVPVLYALAFAVAAVRWQQPQIDALKARGLKRASTWRFCPMAILLTLATIAVLEVISKVINIPL